MPPSILVGSFQVAAGSGTGAVFGTMLFWVSGGQLAAPGARSVSCGSTSSLPVRLATWVFRTGFDFGAGAGGARNSLTFAMGSMYEDAPGMCEIVCKPSANFLSF
ncbi:MAG: hypothetical protein WCE40_18160, partial [Polyangia bacterium]